VSPRLKLIIIFFVLAMLLLVGRARVAPALSPRDNDIVRIAFMNGYLAALKLDPARSEQLKRDEKLLRQIVEKAAADYLNLINTMNK
jgi:hypothetical protein